MKYYAIWIGQNKTMFSQFFPHGIEKNVILRDKLSLTRYFARIAALFTLPAKIVVFGPGATKYEFRQYCSQHEAAISTSIMEIASMEGFTDWNRLINKSRPYFGSHLPMSFVPEGIVINAPYTPENFNH